MNSWKDTNNNSWHIHPTGDNDKNYFISGMESAHYILHTLDYPYNQRILEYGCGNGRILKHLQALDIYGCDINKKYVEEAKKQKLKVELLENCNMFNFDVIFSYTVFIHLNLENSKIALKYIYDRLKTNGKAYLQIPIYETNRTGCSYIDVNTMTINTFKSTVETIGFKILETHTNKGSFSYTNIGLNHEKFQVLVK